MRIRDRFNRDRVQTVVVGETLTKQEFKDECDINLIVKRAERGLVPRTNPRQPVFGDFSNVPSLQDAFELTQAANEAFMELPAALRRELGNDPANLDHLTEEQAKRYGLLKPVKEPLESSPEADGASEGGTPSVKEPKAPKAVKAPKAPKADNPDQD